METKDGYSVDDGSESSVAAEDAPQALCPKCLSPILPHANLCASCGVPLSVAGPLEHVQAVGYVYREGSNRPRKPILVIGMWVILGPPALIFLAGSLYGLAHLREIIASIRNGDDVVSFLLGVAWYGGFGLIGAWLLYKTTTNYFRLRAKRPAAVDQDADE